MGNLTPFLKYLNTVYKACNLKVNFVKKWIWNILPNIAKVWSLVVEMFSHCWRVKARILLYLPKWSAWSFIRINTLSLNLEQSHANLCVNYSRPNKMNWMTKFVSYIPRWYYNFVQTWKTYRTPWSFLLTDRNIQNKI